MVHESSHYLGKECEVFDAELYGISKATYLATKLLDQPTTDVWIFCDNQSAVSRMANSIPMPGQEYILRALNNIKILKNAKITTHIHWVPGHVNVKGNERADQLAKEGTTSSIFLTTLPDRKKIHCFYPVPHLFWVYTPQRKIFPLFFQKLQAR